MDIVNYPAFCLDKRRYLSLSFLFDGYTCKNRILDKITHVFIFILKFLRLYPTLMMPYQPLGSLLNVREEDDYEKQ